MSQLWIDPGAVRCGVAVFKNGECFRAEVMSPEHLFEKLHAGTREDIDGITAMGELITLIGMEEFRLYPWKAAKKGFDTLKEVETIGTVRWLALQLRVNLVMQPASVMKVAEGHLRAEGIQLRAKERDGRAAELHGYYHNLRATRSV